MTQTILVTGGAGYIGSHTTLALLERGDDVVVVDNLSNSSRRSLETVERLTGRSVVFVEADLAHAGSIDEVFSAHPISSVIHFAGLKAVGESVEEPVRYYQTNLMSTLNLMAAMAKAGVWDLVFSSSATVYGDPEILPIPEGAPLSATNPYGSTKLMIEDICREVAKSDSRWQITLLRYFNPVGAHESGDMGEDPLGIPNNLVPFVMQVAVGRREQVRVFGNNYDTADGTGVRDYIHVVDLAAGHLAALDRLEPGCRAINLGTGNGASVLDVIAATSSVSGVDIKYEIVGRRAGDIATSLADPSLAHSDLDWRADRNLETMLTDSWRWQSKHPDGYES